MDYFKLSEKQENQLASLFHGIDERLSPFATKNEKAVRKRTV